MVPWIKKIYLKNAWSGVEFDVFKATNDIKKDCLIRSAKRIDFKERIQIPIISLVVVVAFLAGLKNSTVPPINQSAVPSVLVTLARIILVVFK